MINGFPDPPTNSNRSEATGAVIEGNYIGTDITGSMAVANGRGIFVTSADNTIGGTTPQARNVIAGNTVGGIRIGVGNPITPFGGNHVIGNFIGTKANGAERLVNGLNRSGLRRLFQ